MENSKEVPQKTERELPQDPTVPLLGTHLGKTIIQTDTHTLMFIATLFTIAKTWKQPKSPLTDERIKKVWYIHTIECY